MTLEAMEMNRWEMVCLNKQIKMKYKPIFKVKKEEERKKASRNGNLTDDRKEMERSVTCRKFLKCCKKEKVDRNYFLIHNDCN